MRRVPAEGHLKGTAIVPSGSGRVLRRSQSAATVAAAAARCLHEARRAQRARPSSPRMTDSRASVAPRIRVPSDSGGAPQGGDARHPRGRLASHRPTCGTCPAMRESSVCRPSRAASRWCSRGALPLPGAVRTRAKPFRIGAAAVAVVFRRPAVRAHAAHRAAVAAPERRPRPAARRGDRADMAAVTRSRRSSPHRRARRGATRRVQRESFDAGAARRPPAPADHSGRRSAVTKLDACSTHSRPNAQA